MKTELIAISKLKLLENNPRRITKDQMDKLCRSIESDPAFLECRPVLVNFVRVWPELEPVKEEEEGKTVKVKDTYHVYAGNQRVRAAKKLGLKEIPCIVEYDLDESTIKKRIIQDNKTYGEFDFDMLANQWDVEMLIECGFSPEDILGDLSNISDDERNENKDEEEEAKLCKTCGKKL